MKSFRLCMSIFCAGQKQLRDGKNVGGAEDEAAAAAGIRGVRKRA